MGMTSAAEAKLDARIRPEITVLRSRTPYPRRAAGRAPRGTALTVLPGGAGSGQHSRHAGEPASAGTVRVGVALTGITAATVARPAIRQAAARQDLAGEAASGPARRAAVAGARPGTMSAVRLTRRGKIVVGALMALAAASLAALIWLAVAGQAEAAGHVTRGGSGNSMLRVVVRPGQTLWSIAVRADPAADPRVVIQQIIDDNALRGSSIQAGQVLWVPRV
jgi:nucleoid-associated protein YgaU